MSSLSNFLSHCTDLITDARKAPRLLAFWIAFYLALGFLQLYLFADCHSPDGATHFLFARWAWQDPAYFVDVWPRPLFTLLFAFPALLGFYVARMFAVAVALATAWQCWLLARELKLARPALVFALLLAQPVFFVLFTETMTEPLCGLLFVIAFRLYALGKIRMSAVVASLMILTRPEGFFLGLLWSVWMLTDKRLASAVWQRILWCGLLATGVLCWELAGAAITGDFLHIKHSWPSIWTAGSAAFGTGSIFSYLLRLPEIVGPLFLLPFVLGLWSSRKHPYTIKIATAFFALFVIHSVTWRFGLFGAAGYPRYFVCISPAIAIVTLDGLNALCARIRQIKPATAGLMGIIALTVSLGVCFLYRDAFAASRDAGPINQAQLWWRAHELPVTRFVWSEPFQDVAFDRNPRENSLVAGDPRSTNISRLKDMPRGTLVFWDGRVGQAYFNISVEAIEALGYRRLYYDRRILSGYALKDHWFGYGGPRRQEFALLYKD